MTFEELFKARLRAIHSSGLYRELTCSEGLSFIHNDYLGLSTHPEILEAGEWALKVSGSGSRGSRLLGGHGRLFEDTENEIAEFFGSPSALFFSSGYLANLAVIQVLGGFVDLVVSDEKNHASLIDAIRLSGRSKKVIEHNQWLHDWKQPSRDLLNNRLLLVTESLFSMDGDFCDLSALRAIMSNTESFLVIDEAHAAGVFREDGRGFLPRNVDWARTAVTVTFGKAFGVGGAAILCSRDLRDLLINQGRTFIYTTAPSPVIAAMVSAALKVVASETWRRQELWERAEMVRHILSEGIAPADLKKGELTKDDVWAPRSPIIPFLIPGEDRALRFCQNMRESGVELKAIRYPTVSRGSERVRISLNLGVSRENTELMAREVVRRWTEFSSQERTQA